jgi:RNA polymerase sigma-70 factor, ECF subfamily
MRDDLAGSAGPVPPFDAMIPGKAPRKEYPAPSARQAPEEIPQSPAGEPSDHDLLLRSREGDQDAATQLYRRYAKRLINLVERQCSAELARRAGVEDIVQSVFGSFYDIPDQDELWKLLLVIALHKVRGKATYHHAAKRDAHRTIGGVEARRRLEGEANSGASAFAYLELVFEEILERLPPESRGMVTLRIEGREVAEVAQLTGRSRRSVERILQETRSTLSDLLQKED